MLIVIDVGNTHINLGIFNKAKLLQEFRISTNRHATADEAGLIISGLLSGVNPSGSWEGVVLSSVVPELDTVLQRAIRNVAGVAVLKISPTMHLPIKNHYHPAQAVGTDRLVNAVAAVKFLGAPVIIVDFGTAITVDAVSRQRAYVGGAILPGLSLAADTLAMNTSLLPRVELKLPRRALGRNTEESLRAGLLFGAAGAVGLLIKKFKKEIGGNTPVVATGGMAGWVTPHCRGIKVVHPHLTLEGLRLVWEYTVSRRKKN